MTDEAIASLHQRLDRLEAKLDEIHVVLVPDEDDFEPDEKYGVAEIAKKLGVTRQSIYLAIEAGRLQRLNTGSVRRVLVKGSTVIAWRRGQAAAAPAAEASPAGSA